jgi:hypothetical protein
MWQKKCLMFCFCALFVVSSGCNDESRPTPTAPPPAPHSDPPVGPPDEPPVKLSNLELLRATSARGRRIVERVRALPDVARETKLESSTYRFDAERSFVVRGNAGGTIVEATYMVMPDVSAPSAAWKVIVNIETPRQRTAGVILATREPTRGGREVDGVWMEPRDMQLVWGTGQWTTFFDCMTERTTGSVIACAFTCAWGLYATPHCFLVCSGAQLAGHIVQCAIRALRHGEVHDAEPPVFGGH